MANVLIILVTMVLCYQMLAERQSRYKQIAAFYLGDNSATANTTASSPAPVQSLSQHTTSPPSHIPPVQYQRTFKEDPVPYETTDVDIFVKPEDDLISTDWSSDHEETINELETSRLSDGNKPKTMELANVDEFDRNKEYKTTVTCLVDNFTNDSQDQIFSDENHCMGINVARSIVQEVADGVVIEVMAGTRMEMEDATLSSEGIDSVPWSEGAGSQVSEEMCASPASPTLLPPPHIVLQAPDSCRTPDTLYSHDGDMTPRRPDSLHPLPPNNDSLLMRKSPVTVQEWVDHLPVKTSIP